MMRDRTFLTMSLIRYSLSSIRWTRRGREYGGSGIGLSIVAASMAAHNKNYGVYNVENGVVFYFDLDIIQQDDGEPEMIPENSADNTSEQ